MHGAISRLPNSRTRDVPSVAISAAICVWTAALSIAINAACFHWFLIPTVGCGIVIGTDAVDWFRRRLEIFDPAGLLGLYGTYFFFLAPLLHVILDFWVDDWIALNSPPEDWRPWIGRMAALNFVGLLMYRRALQLCSRGQPTRVVWKIESRRFVVVLSLLLLLAAGTQCWVYFKFGGIMNYISAFEERKVEAFFGYGRTFVLSESFPLMLIIGIAVLGRSKTLARNGFSIFILLIFFLLLTLLFGGLRGNRSPTIWNLFCAIGITHFFLRPISKKTVLVGIASLAVFAYSYGFYKWGGREAFARILDSEDRALLVDESKRSFARTLLVDLGRCDNQAYILYRLVEGEDYKYGYGRTYLGALALYVPKSIWPDRPPTKRKEGTEAVFGHGTYIREEAWNWAYGLGGETMLNFGWVAIPFAYGVFGAIVGFIRRFGRTLANDDGRILMLPFLASLCFIILAWDSNNIVTHCVRLAVMPSLLLLLSTKRMRIGTSES